MPMCPTARWRASSSKARTATISPCAEPRSRSGRPDWTPWIDFFLRALQQQKRRLEAKIERERILLGELPELSIKILELARERGRVTIAEAAKATGASRNTIKDHVRTLTDNKHLTRHGAGRG